MNKITGINLNGNAYQLEEAGFSVLSSYLNQAKARLSDNPDQQEIMADLEQAIADKFRKYLSVHKSVITEEEVTTVIGEMGPVHGEPNVESETSAQHGPKRLYRVEKGELLGGVATGLAAYFDIDVVIVRVILIALIILTSGGFGLVYFIAWMVIPPARTQEEQAAASGAPFNAEELIARAKAEYSKLGTKSAEWRGWWRDMRNEQKKQAREEYKTWKKYEKTQQRHHRPGVIGQLVQLVIISFALWLGYHKVPVIHDFLDASWHLLHQASDQVAQFIVDNDQ